MIPFAIAIALFGLAGWLFAHGGYIEWVSMRNHERATEQWARWGIRLRADDGIRAAKALRYLFPATLVLIAIAILLQAVGVS